MNRLSIKMDKETKFFKFLEGKKEELYRIENKGKQYKTTIAKLELLKEIYIFWNFKFLRVALLRPNEKVRWDDYMKVISGTLDEKESSTIRVMKAVYSRLENYDLLKVKNTYFNIQLKLNSKSHPTD